MVAGYGAGNGVLEGKGKGKEKMTENQGEYVWIQVDVRVPAANYMDAAAFLARLFGESGIRFRLGTRRIQHRRSG